MKLSRLIRCLCFLAALFLARAGSASDAAHAIQLPYAPASDQLLHLPPDLSRLPQPALSRDIPGRRIPETILFSNLAVGQLTNRAVPLPEANTLAHLNFGNWLVALGFGVCHFARPVSISCLMDTVTHGCSF